VKSQLADGKLVRLTDLELPAPGGYYLTWNGNRVLSPAAEILRGPLREIAAKERDN
jgi:LysR family glycine cleavage system transcriptional activator